MKAAEHEPCWHETGRSTSWLHGKAVDVVCCFCGIRSARVYEIVSQQKPGHGKYFSINVALVVDEPKHLVS